MVLSHVEMQHPEIVVKKKKLLYATIADGMTGGERRAQHFIGISFEALDLVAFQCKDTLISLMLHTQIFSPRELSLF